MERIRCNQCGKILEHGEGSRQEDFLKVTKEWGYFSKKDLVLHEFYLCEDCYDKWIEGFQIPVQTKGVEEVL